MDDFDAWAQERVGRNNWTDEIVNELKKAISINDNSNGDRTVISMSALSQRWKEKYGILKNKEAIIAYCRNKLNRSSFARK